MLRTTLASIRAHKLRLLSTTLSIVLGVGFIAGTYVLTDTMLEAFNEVFAATNEGIDVAVRGRTEFSSTFTEADRPLVPADQVEALADIPGVAAVSPEASGIAVIIDDEGQPIGGQGPPTLGISAPIDQRLSSADLRQGAFPHGHDEVAVDAATAEAQDLAIGDRLEIVTTGSPQTYTLVGIVGFGELDNLAGATLSMFAPEHAAALYAQDGFREVYLLAEDGVDVDVLVERVQQVVPDDLEVLTGDELAASITAEVTEALGFFTTALLVFAGVALFVGSFLIANTFTIIVAQRTRELALLRAVGASRRQIVASVLLEALAVGLAGSVVGLGLGILVAEGLKAVLDSFGIALPAGDTVLAGRTIVVSLVIGVLVTLLAAFGPAIRATRVPPVAAMQAVAAPPQRPQGVLRHVIGGLLLVAGVALLFVGLNDGGGIQAVGAGAVVTLLGAAALSPLVASPVVRLLGAPIAATRGIAGTLAKQNALRSPRRTAATASALMIGLALVAFIMILGASIQQSAVVAIDRAFLAEFQVQPANQAGPPGGQAFPLSVADELQALDEVTVATPLTFGEFQLDGDGGFVGGVDPDVIGQTLAVDFVAGSFADLDEGIVVSVDAAEGRGLQVGDTVTTAFAATGQRDLEVQGIFDGENLDTDHLISLDTYDEVFVTPGVAAMYVKLADGVDVDAARAAVDAVIDRHPTLQVLDLGEVKAQVNDQIDQLLGLMTALLGLSVVIALVGIVNTLALSVIERTRELGLLRAVGAGRPQIRQMVRWESVLIAILGAVLGLTIGSVFAWMVVQALASSGITEFVLPGGRLAAGVAMAALAGVLAAVVPSIRAARTDILRALDAQ